MSFYKQKFKDILVNQNSRVLTITLNLPESSNAITLDMVDSFQQIFPYADRDPEIELIVMTGAGKNFCAGGNVKDMKAKEGMFEGDSDELRIRYEFGIQMIPKIIEAVSTPIIAQVNGAAIGAGCDLAMMCDLRVGDSSTKFAETFARLGLVPGDGGTFFLTRVLGYSKAMEMFLTGRRISGIEAQNFGLLNFYTEDSIIDKTKEVGEMILKNSFSALSMTKKVLKTSYPTNLHSQLDMLSSFQGILQRKGDHFDRLEAL